MVNKNLRHFNKFVIPDLVAKNRPDRRKITDEITGLPRGGISD
jgi:hypothetical protein